MDEIICTKNIFFDLSFNGNNDKWPKKMIV